MNFRLRHSIAYALSITSIPLRKMNPHYILQNVNKFFSNVTEADHFGR
jgi:hypothetical protein